MTEFFFCGMFGCYLHSENAFGLHIRADIEEELTRSPTTKPCALVSRRSSRNKKNQSHKPTGFPRKAGGLCLFPNIRSPRNTNLHYAVQRRCRKSTSNNLSAHSMPQINNSSSAAKYGYLSLILIFR
jgi:hypothetical protein